MEFPRRIITSTHFWHIAQYYKKRQGYHHLAKIHVCYVSPRSTREQRAHYLVHQLDSKTKPSKHTHINLLSMSCRRRAQTSYPRQRSGREDYIKHLMSFYRLMEKKEHMADLAEAAKAVLKASLTLKKHSKV